MEKLTCFCATDIICVSNGLKQVLVNDGITRKSPIVIWNGSVCGIDSIKYSPKSEEEKMDLRSKLKLNEKDYVLGFVGRIVGDKGINELVSAFLQLSSENDNLRLLLVGPMDEIGGGISEETKKIIRENNKIIITGYQEDVPLYLSLMDIFIFPTYREGFGLSLMEAAAMEIPCISSDVIGCNEIIEHETTGLLIKPKSVQEIVSAVKRLMSDEVLYQKIKNNCRQSIITRYEQEKLWADYLDFYIQKSQHTKSI